MNYQSDRSIMFKNIQHFTTLLTEKYNTASKDSEVLPYRIPKVLHKCTRLDYGQKGITGSSHTLIIQKKKIIVQTDVRKWLREDPLLQQEFNSIVAILIKNLSISQNDAKVELYRYVWTYLNVLTGYLEVFAKSNLEGIVNDFIDYLQKRKIPFKSSIWLQNIMITESLGYIDINKKFNLRIPIEADYDHESVLLQERYSNRMKPYCSAILECSVDAYGYDLHKWEDLFGVMINSLRLYFNCSVVPITYNTTSGSVFQKTYDTTLVHEYNRNLTTGFFKPINKSGFAKFYNHLSPFIPSSTSTILDDGVNPHPFDIGFHWYMVALTNKLSTNGKIAALISCLESIYSISNYELRHRLSQICAFHLSIYGKNPLEVMKDIKSSYDIRSAYYHGGKLRSERNPKNKILLTKLLHHCRQSLILLLPLKENINNKQDFITLLSQAILDSSTKHRLIEQLESSISF